MTKVLVTGGNGQVGSALVGTLRERGIEAVSLNRHDCDISDSKSVRASLADHVPTDVVVNCAAFTAVDLAEDQEKCATSVNAVGPGNIAQACHSAGIPMVHLSTDFVFDGSSTRPYREEDRTRPLSVYGTTKLAGEVAVRDVLRRHVIVRTSWLFSGSGANFLRTIVNHATSRSHIKVVNDQVGSPTYAPAVAEFLASVIQQLGSDESRFGTFHFCGHPPVTWYGFAQRIVGELGELHPHSLAEVLPVSALEYGAAATRPSYSVLDCSLAQAVFGVSQPCWESTLREAVRKAYDLLRA